MPHTPYLVHVGRDGLATNAHSSAVDVVTVLLRGAEQSQLFMINRHAGLTTVHAISNVQQHSKWYSMRCMRTWKVSRPTTTPFSEATTAHNRQRSIWRCMEHGAIGRRLQNKQPISRDTSQR